MSFLVISVSSDGAEVTVWHGPHGGPIKDIQCISIGQLCVHGPGDVRILGVRLYQLDVQAGPP